LSSTLEPQTANSPTLVWRVATTGTATRFSWIDPITAASKGGHRFDVPGGGVVYASTAKRGCFAETLQTLRIKLNSGAVLAAARDTGHMPPGNIAQSWRDGRRKFLIELRNTLPFVDIEHEETRAYLEDTQSLILFAHGLDALTVADVRSNNRRLTRALAWWAYTQIDESAATGTPQPLYAGIRYVSKHGDHECWAIFDRTAIEERRAEGIDEDDEDLRAAARLLNLTVN
jgi:hypothetical protein